MATYLLGTQTLLDRISGKSKYPIRTWLDSLPTESNAVYLSAVSIGYARSTIEGIRNAAKRQKYMSILENVVRGFERNGIVPVDNDIADTWSALIAGGKTWEKYSAGRKGSPIVRMVDAELLVHATALTRNMTLVEPEQPCHSEMATYGLAVETLGE